MTSKPVALLLADLGVTKTHTRPYVSNDNPFSEAQFKTLKYRPEFPDRFGSIEDARALCHVFFPWYNTEHRHSGLGLLTPHEVHYGLAEQRVEARARVLAAAYAAHPERFVAGLPRPPALPTEVWINKPKAALAEPNRDSEPEVVTNFASRAPQSHAADSTLTQVSPRIGVRERFGSIGAELHIAAVAPAHEDDAERAVRAGLAMVNAVQGLNYPPAVPSPKGGSGKSSSACALHVRVGIHTGLAVIGDAGERADVFGDSVNLASRIQSAAAPDTVVISSASLQLIRGIFVIQELGAQPLKGFAYPVSHYRVVQPSGVRSRLDLAAGNLTPLVGRQSELGMLLDAWERVLEGTGQTVLVQGEPGVGKSRLVYELRERLGAAQHTWLECRCSPYTQRTAFQPLIELVTQGVRLEPEDTPAEKLTKLEDALARADFSLSEMVPLFADFLSIPLGDSYAPLDLDPDVQRRKTLAALAAWNLRLGALQPLIMLMEDLHWCDPSSLALIEWLVQQSPTARVLLICTARPEFQSPWGPRSNLAAMTLARLTRRQAREIVSTLGPTLPAAAMDAIVARADGVPLYIEELTRAVLESETPGGEVATPATLQDSLMARLDRLSAAKEVALRAAVLGREFTYELLAATAGLDEGALMHGLARLVEAELLFVRGTPPEATYVFKHGLIQEMAYQSLLKRTRQELHARVARALRERVSQSGRLRSRR